MKQPSIQCLGVYVVPCDDAPWREDLDCAYRSLGFLDETVAYRSRVIHYYDPTRPIDDHSFLSAVLSETCTKSHPSTEYALVLTGLVTIAESGET